MRVRMKMERILVGSVAFLVLSCVSAPPTEKEGQPVLSAGVAKMKITPVTPLPMSGYDGRK